MRRDNSEIRLCADKRFGESETHQKLVCGVPGAWEPLQPAVRVEGRLPASQSTAPAEGREPEGLGPATGGGGGVEERKGEHERERKQPNLGWVLRMENGGGGGCSWVRREAEGAGRRARVQGLRRAAGE